MRVYSLSYWLVNSWNDQLQPWRKGRKIKKKHTNVEGPKKGHLGFIFRTLLFLKPKHAKKTFLLVYQLVEFKFQCKLATDCSKQIFIFITEFFLPARPPSITFVAWSRMSFFSILLQIYPSSNYNCWMDLPCWWSNLLSKKQWPQTTKFR